MKNRNLYDKEVVSEKRTEMLKFRYASYCQTNDAIGIPNLTYEDWLNEEYEVEMVNHPNHYNQGGIECIDAMIQCFGVEAVKSFCIINGFKYLWRFNHKNGSEDVEKAKWYIDKYLELEGNKK